MIISLELDSETPLYEQLCNQIIIGIASGRLAPGERLPAVRQLADDLGINMMTVNKAYALLKQKGYLVIDRRHGAYISSYFAQADALPPSLEKQLTLIIAQAKLHGIRQDQFAAICQSIYASMSGQ
jgi:DNA-binding transcriptional regulator YhcF (GntR family)